jgi:MFS family permease
MPTGLIIALFIACPLIGALYRRIGRKPNTKKPQKRTWFFSAAFFVFRVGYPRFGLLKRSTSGNGKQRVFP